MKRIIWVTVVIITIGIIAGILAKQAFKLPEHPGMILEEKEEEEVKKEEVIVGYGWSIKPDTSRAINEAINKLKLSFTDKSPEYLILFSNANYDSGKIIKEIIKTWPEIQIYGGTSSGAVMTRDGFHKGGLALMGIYSEHIDFGVGGTDITGIGAEEAGKRAIQLAIKNAGREGEIPDMVLMTGSVGNEENILSGIEEVIGKEIPIIGGSAGDNDLSGKWQQFANKDIYKNGVALTAIFTDLTIGWAFEAGYHKTIKEGIITKASGRIIYEIDNRPAAEVYNEWTNGLIQEELEKGGPVLAKTTFYPLAKLVSRKGGEIRYLSIHPLEVNINLKEVNFPSKSLTVFANVKTGERIMLMQGNWELLLNRCHTTPSNALESKNVGKNQGYFAIYTYCAGTMLAIPEEQRSKMPVLVRNTIGPAVPFIGTFTLGEQGFLAEVGNKHGNLVNSMIVFAPAK